MPLSDHPRPKQALLLKNYRRGHLLSWRWMEGLRRNGTEVLTQPLMKARLAASERGFLARSVTLLGRPHTLRL